MAKKSRKSGFWEKYSGQIQLFITLFIIGFIVGLSIGSYIKEGGSATGQAAFRQIQTTTATGIPDKVLFTGCRAMSSGSVMSGTEACREIGFSTCNMQAYNYNEYYYESKDSTFKKIQYYNAEHETFPCNVRVNYTAYSRAITISGDGYAEPYIGDYKFTRSAVVCCSE